MSKQFLFAKSVAFDLSRLALPVIDANFPNPTDPNIILNTALSDVGPDDDEDELTCKETLQKWGRINKDQLTSDFLLLESYLENIRWLLDKPSNMTL